MSATAARLLTVFASRAVIDFPEQLVVLFDERVVGLELESLFVRAPGLCQFAFVLVGDGEVVQSGGVAGIDLRRAFPSVDRFAPQTPLRDGDAEFDLLLGV